MTDPKNSGDEHIEDLLSQLQGIFGRLSHSEEEESKDKVDAASATPPPAAPPPTPPPPAPVAPPVEAVPEPVPVPAPAAPEPVPVVEAPPPAPEPVPAIVEPTPVPATAAAPDGAAAPAAADNSLMATAIFYPAGREAEAKILAQKLEVLTPKFTKVEFRLRPGMIEPYDPKSEWRDLVVGKATEGRSRLVFLIVDRPLDDARRKPIASELDSRKIYFQDVPLLSIEKKAFYTDLLLGLVFFFDSNKPAAENG